MTTTVDHELATFGVVQRVNDGEAARAHGLSQERREAWLALVGCFLLEALVWGFPSAGGIFQTYLIHHGPFQNQHSTISAISTTTLGIMYLSSPFVALAMQRHPGIFRPAGLAGVAIMDIALIVASFTDSAAVLMATQGVLYAIGGLLAYFPAVWVIDKLYQENKGKAFAFILTGTGISGAVVPFTMQWLLSAYGWRTALRAWSVVLTVFALPATLIVKNTTTGNAPKALTWKDFDFCKMPLFWLFQFGNILQSMAYFLPGLWMPTFAVEIHSSSGGNLWSAGPVAICLLNVAACGGYLMQGFLVDRYHVATVIAIVTLGTMISVFVFWGLATSLPFFYIFAVAFGLTGGGYAATWAGCAQVMRKANENTDTGLVISLMCAGKGIGVILSGPVSEQLLKISPWPHTNFAYGSQYAAVIVFTGMTATLGGTAYIAKLLNMV